MTNNNVKHVVVTVPIQCRCPICGSIFKTTSTDDNECLALDIPRDKDGYFILVCSFRCAKKWRARKSRKELEKLEIEAVLRRERSKQKIR